VTLKGKPAVSNEESDDTESEESYEEDYDEDDKRSHPYSRKEKSLGELCRRFLYAYGSEGKDVLLLDSCTRELGVERRRIYDIINILESFSVIRRRAKNEY
jgi:E2F/DP family winged-helix DNA-binding domain